MDSMSGQTRHHVRAAYYHNGRTPDDGEPDEVVDTVVWMEGGAHVTGKERFDELEAAYQRDQATTGRDDQGDERGNEGDG